MQTCYAYTGVNTTAGDSWLLQELGDGLTKYKMTKVGDKMAIGIDNMHDYYNCAAVSEKTFSSLDFVLMMVLAERKKVKLQTAVILLFQSMLLD